MIDVEVIAECAIRAAKAYASGHTDYDMYQRTLAHCSLWAQGIEGPTAEQVEARMGELETANSFIGPAPQ